MRWADEYKGVPLVLTEDIKSNNDSYVNDNGVLDWFEEHYEPGGATDFVRLSELYQHYKAAGECDMKKSAFHSFVRQHPKLASDFYRQKRIGGKVLKNILFKHRRKEEPDSGDDDEPPEQFRGSFTDWEDAKYLKLLIRYGQPLKANPPAKKAFLEEFAYRSEASVTAHVNAFNVGAYKAWRAANGGRWAGFAWVKN